MEQSQSVAHIDPHCVRLDGGTQPRATLNETVIAEYADDMQRGIAFPPVVVFHDGADYWLADGFHRVHAARRIGRIEIPADVRQGTQADAQWFSYGVNQSHGLRRTNEDKRRAVEAALRHPMAAQLSSRQIAAHCGVHWTTINNHRASVENLQIEPEPVRLVTRNGTTYPMQTANIGKTATTAPQSGAVVAEDGASLAQDLPQLVQTGANAAQDPRLPDETIIAAIRSCLCRFSPHDATPYLDGLSDRATRAQWQRTINLVRNAISIAHNDGNDAAQDAIGRIEDVIVRQALAAHYAPEPEEPLSAYEQQIAARVEVAPEPEPEPEPVVLPAAAAAAKHAVHYSSATPEWYTPRHIVDKVIELFGHIDLDPCSNATGDAANVPARYHYTKADDGLTQSWAVPGWVDDHGDQSTAVKVYMNPPYGNEIGPWTDRLVRAYESGEITEAVALLPARVDTAWFARLDAYPICFVRGRLTFVGGESSAPFPSAIAYLGGDITGFIETFGPLGNIRQPAPLPFEPDASDASDADDYASIENEDERTTVTVWRGGISEIAAEAIAHLAEAHRLIVRGEAHLVDTPMLSHLIDVLHDRAGCGSLIEALSQVIDDVEAVGMREAA